MGVIFKRNKGQKTYSALHNKAVTSFKRSSKALLFAGILNIVGAIVGVSSSVTSFPTCFGINMVAFHYMNASSMNVIVAKILIVFIGLIFGVGAIVLSVFTGKAKRSLLIISVVSYGIDTLFLIIYISIMFGLNIEGISASEYFLSLGIHIIITIFIVVMFYQYYNVINIEKVFKGYNPLEKK